VDVGIDDNTFRAGARVNVPLAGVVTVQPWVEAGVLVGRTSVSASNGDIGASLDSDWTVGFEGGAGLSFAVAPRVSLTPGVRYRQHKAEFDDFDGSGDVKYIAVDLGVNIKI
jgi:opacity protein-like surface antigen